MVRSAALRVTATAWIIALTGCGSNHYIQRGADLYGAGRYVEADEVLERSEPRLDRAPADQRAAYATYRGATFVALGDLPRAQHWLRVASEIEHARPGTLSEEEHAVLDSAWRVLASRMPPALAPANTAIASSSQVPSPNTGPALPNTPESETERALVPQ